MNWFPILSVSSSTRRKTAWRKDNWKHRRLCICALQRRKETHLFCNLGLLALVSAGAAGTSGAGLHVLLLVDERENFSLLILKAAGSNSAGGASSGQQSASWKHTVAPVMMCLVEGEVAKKFILRLLGFEIGGWRNTIKSFKMGIRLGHCGKGLTIFALASGVWGSIPMSDIEQ